MSGDLSLSGALGGLRIVNPDDVALAPPSSPDPLPESLIRPPPVSSSSPENTIARSRSGDILPTTSSKNYGSGHSSAVGSIGFDPDIHILQNDGHSTASLRNPLSPSTPPPETFPRAQGLTHRTSMPLAHQAHQPTPYEAHSERSAQQFRGAMSQIASARPMSGMYQQPNSSSSSTSSYRYRDDLALTDGNGPTLSRSGSVDARGLVRKALAPSREGSRNYRSSSQQMNGGNGPLPPRRNSRRMRAPTNANGSAQDPAIGSHAISTTIPNTADDWRERGAAMGNKAVTDASGHTQTRAVKKGVQDFNFGRTLGEGSYSTVLAATDRSNLKEYAIKVLDKRHIIKEKKVKYVNIERDTLNRLTEHPGIVRLYYTFQDERSLYFVLDLATGGELLGVLKKMGSFDIECTRFYGAQILDSIAYMHSRGVIHRDLKPENVLLDREMHTKITDFGTAKILPDPRPSAGTFDIVPGNPTDGAESDRAVSFVGTAEYVSPELLRDKNACKASDLWAFGCIIYQLLAGRPPFKAANEYLTFQKILSLEYSFPEGFPSVARDLVERLLVLEPAHRMPVEHIRNHEFFEGVAWGRSLWRQKAPRLKAYTPPPAEAVKLNGVVNVSYPPPISTGVASSQPPLSQQHRPQLRGITELPPPSQLDIDWSPVLTHINERILKLGNLIVSSGPLPTSPNGKHGEAMGVPSEKPKFSRFFSGNASKRRERLVLITSKARLVIVPTGGNEKKIKMELDCLQSGVTWRSFMDAKGLIGWQVDNRDKQFTFEDPRATTSDPAGSKYSTQEWLQSLESACELAKATSFVDSYSDSSLLNLESVNSSRSSPAETLSRDAAMPMSGPSAGDGRHHLRHTLRRNTSETMDDGTKASGRKRFSKRHSKSGLAAVF